MEGSITEGEAVAEEFWNYPHLSPAEPYVERSLALAVLVLPLLYPERMVAIHLSRTLLYLAVEAVGEVMAVEVMASAEEVVVEQVAQTARVEGMASADLGTRVDRRLAQVVLVAVGLVLLRHLARAVMVVTA